MLFKDFPSALSALMLMASCAFTATCQAQNPPEEPMEIVFGIDGKQVLPDTSKNAYIYCRLTKAMDAKRGGLDYWAAKKAGAELCKADAVLLKNAKISKYIERTIAKYYEGE